MPQFLFWSKIKSNKEEVLGVILPAVAYKVFRRHHEQDFKKTVHIKSYIEEEAEFKKHVSENPEISSFTICKCDIVAKYNKLKSPNI